MICDKYVESVNVVENKSYSFSHKGKRLYNEDFYIADDLEGIYIITDGMGGYKGGNLACRIAAQACYNYLIQNKEVAGDELIHFIRLQLKEVALAQPEFQFMGTTLCCLYIRDSSINLIHIGDSKIIIVGDKNYQSTDHTFAQELVNQQLLKVDEYAHHPMRHILTRCISARENYNAEYHRIPLKSGLNTFFLCSDGVTESFSTTEIIQLIRSEPDIHTVLQTIEQSAVKYSQDNSTAIIVALNYNRTIN